MTRPRLAIAVALAVLRRRHESSPAPRTDERAFVVRMVEAINSKNLERRRALAASGIAALRERGADPFYAWMVTRQSRDPIPADYTWKVDPVPPDEPLMFADKLDYPVRPTHMLQITFNPAPSSSRTIVFQLVREGIAGSR